MAEFQPGLEKPATEEKSPPKKPVKKKDSWFLWSRDIVIVLILVLLFRTHVAEANYIPSPSMEPTLKVHDRIIVDKLSLNWRPIERGELVVFHPPLNDKVKERWIKRVIGVPGDMVEILRGVVYVNGERLDEPYIENPGGYTEPPIRLEVDDPATRVNEGEYYLMGDNRGNSRDSHIWGPCPSDNIIGRAIFRYWPINEIGSLEGGGE
ncbi:MAG: signal peptidase I [bacterium]|nr:signal peptidase I [bacterium]